MNRWYKTATRALERGCDGRHLRLEIAPDKKIRDFSEVDPEVFDREPSGTEKSAVTRSALHAGPAAAVERRPARWRAGLRSCNSVAVDRLVKTFSVERRCTEDAAQRAAGKDSRFQGPAAPTGMSASVVMAVGAAFYSCSRSRHGCEHALERAAKSLSVGAPSPFTFPGRSNEARAPLPAARADARNAPASRRLLLTSPSLGVVLFRPAGRGALAQQFGMAGEGRQTLLQGLQPGCQPASDTGKDRRRCRSPE
jgi:hypothetical protein